VKTDGIFKALSDKNRRKILGLLAKKNLKVGELLQHFDFSQPTLSSHLSILKRTGLVGVVRQGRYRVYLLNRKLIADFANELLRFSGTSVEKKLWGDIEIRQS